MDEVTGDAQPSFIPAFETLRGWWRNIHEFASQEEDDYDRHDRDWPYFDLPRQPGVRLIVPETTNISFVLFHEESKIGQFLLMSQGECPPIDIDVTEVVGYLGSTGTIGVFYFRWGDREEEPLSLFAQRWKDIVGIPYIPYDLAERREKLAGAYEVLAEYIEAWEIVGRSEGSNRVHCSRPRRR